MKNVKLLSAVFFIMQIGISLFLQYTILYLDNRYSYPPLVMGIFYGYIGVFFGITLLVIVPKLVKYFIIEKLIVWGIFFSGCSILAFLIFPNEWFIWIMSACFGLSSNIAYSLLMTTFSNQVSQEKQGWIMGIYGACIALAFAVGGITAFLLPFIGTRGLLFIGSLCYFVSFIIMIHFNRSHTLHGPQGPVPKKTIP